MLSRLQPLGKGNSEWPETNGKYARILRVFPLSRRVVHFSFTALPEFTAEIR